MEEPDLLHHTLLGNTVYYEKVSVNKTNRRKAYVILLKRSVIHQTDALHNCKGKALQILTAELGTKASKVMISILYRAKFVISGHINTGCLTERHRKK
jgi:hypothetical protein